MKEHAREWMAFAIVILFGFALVRNPSDTLMVGALIAAFSTAIGYYLGGSKVGADTATKNAETVSQAALSSGSEPQAVIVTNSEDAPVPVDAK